MQCIEFSVEVPSQLVMAYDKIIFILGGFSAVIYFTKRALQKKTCRASFVGRVWAASRRALALEHAPAYQFACCQWQRGHRPALSYLVYRWLLFITVVSIAVASFACQRLPRLFESLELNYFKWFIYFTNWGFICIVLQAGLAVAVVHRYRAEENFNIPGDDDEGPIRRRVKTPLLCRMYWLAHIIATDLAFVITLVYWTLVHDPEIHEINAVNLFVHGGNSLIMLVEILVTAHPLRAAHALYGAGAGLAYGIFSAVYWAMGGTDRIGLSNIYPTLNWNTPGSALGFVALCAVVLVSAHMAAAALATVRTRIAARVHPARAHSDRLTLPTH